MYADLMDYQLALPMPPLAAWKATTKNAAIAQGTPLPPLTEQQWQMAYDLQHQSIESAAEDAMRDHVLRSGVVSALEWDQTQYDLVCVHERLSAEAVAERALRRSEGAVDEATVEALIRQNLKGVALFEGIQALLPENQRFVYLTDVAKPLDARVYKPDMGCF